MKTMTDGFRFRPRRSPDIIVTKMMRQAEARTLRVHAGGALPIWTGPARVGKTTTARYLVERINGAFSESDPDAFLSAHFQVGQIADEKKAIRSLFHGTVGTLDEGLYRSMPTEDLARMLIHALRRLHLELIMVDEAGLLSIDALRGMVLARDVAENVGQRLSIVLIGMDDLPTKVHGNPQLAGRVTEFINFRPYSGEEVLTLLSSLHPPYGSLDPTSDEAKRHLRFFEKHYGSLPGLIVPFMYRLDMEGRGRGDKVPTIKELKATHLLTDEDSGGTFGSRGGDED